MGGAEEVTPPPREPLPIDEALPRLVEALRRGPNAVLRAPAGAGQIVLVEPRRLAARAAARRIASERGGNVGDEVG